MAAFPDNTTNVFPNLACTFDSIKILLFLTGGKVKITKPMSLRHILNICYTILQPYQNHLKDQGRNCVFSLQ